MEKHRLPLLLMLAMLPLAALAIEPDSLQEQHRYIHMLRGKAVQGAVLHTNEYLKGNNPESRTMNHSFVAKLQYAFQKPQNTTEASIYRGAYQGVGVAWHEFNPQLSNPLSVYVFQGARIKTISPRLSLNYEWNLGLTCGWKPYDPDTNPHNRVIGSRVTAYINADFYLNWRLNRQMDLNAGVSLTHFSNGNTKLPNSGLNVAGVNAGITYYINRPKELPRYDKPIPRFNRHLSYDIVLYGAWKSMGFYGDEGPTSVPGSFAVVGFNVNPMYNLNHWLNAGLSLDGIYDHSANIRYHEHKDQIYYPKAIKQMALGLSARAEFVMPYFTINLGIGHNVVNARGHLDGWYEMLALKIGVSRHTFIHIGYSLNEFKNPNNLMLGFGVRLNNQRKSQ